jgi:peptide/nickel transport system substrate-binding protein
MNAQMRQLLSLALIIALAATGLACRSSAASTARPTPAGEFRVMVPSRPLTLNPNLQLDEIAIVIGRNVFSQLLSLNEAGRLIPELAHSWSISDDGLTYTFHLREGVRWHDGTPFSSADVRWTLEMLGRDGFFGRDALAPVASITTPDPLTIVLRLKHPWAPFAADLAGPGLSILPRHIYEGHDWRTHPANDRPIGTGPFRFVRWADDRTLVLEANTSYFRSGPYVQRLVFEAVDAEGIAEKLLNGTVHYSVGRPAGIAVDAPPDPLIVRTLPTSGRVYLAMNLRRPPFGDVRVRRALAASVDRLEIITKALSGMGVPAVGWYTPDVEWAYNAAVRAPDYDLKKAAALLDAAGLRPRNGQRFQATLVVPATPSMRNIATVLQAQFAAIGVTMSVERVSPVDWPQRVMKARDFDLTLITGGQGPDPDQLRRRFLADTDTGSYIGYAEQDFRAAVERGARVVDVAQRAAAYYRAQEILARDVPFIPLAEAVKVVVHNRRVSGLPQLEARGLVGAFDFSLVKLRPAGTATR